MGVYQHAACAPLPKETSQCTCQVTGGRTFWRIARISTAYTCTLVHAFILKQETTALLFILVSLMFACDLWMVYSEPLRGLSVVFPSSAILVNSIIGFQSVTVPFIGFLQMLGVVSLHC